MRILITASFHDDALAILRNLADVIYEDWRSTGRVYWGEELLEKIRQEKADAIIVEADAVTDEVVDAIRLQFIGCARNTPKEIDIKAATSKGIPVFFAPGRNTDSVAELTILLILAQARKLIQTDRILKSGTVHIDEARKFAEFHDSLKGVELKQSMVGIVGLGQIGYRVAQLLRGFGTRVIYYDPYVDEGRGKEVGAESVDLETLMRSADFISIHTRATPDTFRMIGKEQLSWMKATAHLINTARSAIIDEDALYEVIKNGIIAGAGLDVHSREPVGSDNRFLEFDNVTVTPHVGGNTEDVVFRQSMMIAQDIERYVKGETPKYLANPEVLKSS